jgi:predicted dinucleotide-binding enzyme
MRIGILGTGNMAQALGAQWARAGHEVLVGGRDEERAAALAARIGSARIDSGRIGSGRIDSARIDSGRIDSARSGTLRDAAQHGRDGAVLLAVPYGAAVAMVADLADALRGRVLIDCTNPVAPGFVLATTGGASAAERIAAAAPGASVVKAFNLCHESVWRRTPPVFDGRPLAVPLCGDDAPALDTVRHLVRDLGCTPVNGGGLDRAGLLEATAALLIGLWVAEGVDAQAIAPPLEYAGVDLP